MNRVLTILLLAAMPNLTVCSMAGEKAKAKTNATAWTQWRGPSRDGQISGTAWPDRLSKESQLWRIPLGPSYSGPIVTEGPVFTTATKNKESEVVYALDRNTGKERWRAVWKGAMTVPFFAAANGSWIRSTPVPAADCGPS